MDWVYSHSIYRGFLRRNIRLCRAIDITLTIAIILNSMVAKTYNSIDVVLVLL